MRSNRMNLSVISEANSAKEQQYLSLKLSAVSSNQSYHSISPIASTEDLEHASSLNVPTTSGQSSKTKINMPRIYQTPEEMLTSLISSKNEKATANTEKAATSHYSFLNPTERSKSKGHSYEALTNLSSTRKITDEANKSSLPDLNDVSYHTIDLNPLNSSSSSKSTESSLSFSNISQPRHDTEFNGTSAIITDIESVESSLENLRVTANHAGDHLIQASPAEAGKSLQQPAPVHLRRSLRLMEKRERNALALNILTSMEGNAQRRKSIRKRKRKSGSVKTKRFRDKSTQTLDSVEMNELIANSNQAVTNSNQAVTNSIPIPSLTINDEPSETNSQDVRDDPLQEPENQRNTAKTIHRRTASSISIVPISEINPGHLLHQETNNNIRADYLRISPEHELAETSIEPLESPQHSPRQNLSVNKSFTRKRTFTSKIPSFRSKIKKQNLHPPESSTSSMPTTSQNDEFPLNHKNVTMRRKLRSKPEVINDTRSTHLEVPKASKLPANEYDHLINSKNVTIRRRDKYRKQTK